MDPRVNRRIGGTAVSALGLGGRSLSVEGRPDESRAIATIHAAIDAGITLIDTSSSYHAADAVVGDNEVLIARALASYAADASEILVATKGGVVRDPDGTWRPDGRPQALRRAVEGSLRRLEVDAIGLYQFHKPDPRVPYADSIGTIREFLDEGVIRMAGISNVDESQVRVAQEVLGGRLSSVQNQFSLSVRDAASMVALCESLGVAFLAWGPLGGAASATLLAGNSMVSGIARAHGVSAAVICLAWLLATSPALVPLVGATRPSTIQDAVLAVATSLTPEEKESLDTLSS
jgi:aryl-alcohol dehydrogenase-like predicted oxidoreductase